MASTYTVYLNDQKVLTDVDFQQVVDLLKVCFETDKVYITIKD